MTLLEDNQCHCLDVCCSSTPNVEVSVKCIEQKLLCNIHKFFKMIYAEHCVEQYCIEHMNMEEIVLTGLRAAVTCTLSTRTSPRQVHTLHVLVQPHELARHCVLVLEELDHKVLASLVQQ